MKLIKSTVLPGLLSIIFPIISACGAIDPRCIDPTQISKNPCTMEFNPVCGCNKKTYSTAERAGVTSWKEGACN